MENDFKIPRNIFAKDFDNNERFYINHALNRLENDANNPLLYLYNWLLAKSYLQESTIKVFKMINENVNNGLIDACYNGLIDVAVYMVNNGATSFEDGLYWACRNGGDSNVIQLMIDCGANNYDECFYWACFGTNVHIDCIKKIIPYARMEDIKNYSEAINIGPEVREYLMSVIDGD